MTGLTRGSARPNQWLRNLNAKIASIPMILTAMVIFVGGTAWTVVYSFTNSKLLPRLAFVGFDQYERLWPRLAGWSRSRIWRSSVASRWFSAW